MYKIINFIEYIFKTRRIYILLVFALLDELKIDLEFCVLYMMYSRFEILETFSFLVYNFYIGRDRRKNV